jgi:hypothetical protein
MLKVQAEGGGGGDEIMPPKMQTDTLRDAKQ